MIHSSTIGNPGHAGTERRLVLGRVPGCRGLLRLYAEAEGYALLVDLRVERLVVEDGGGVGLDEHPYAFGLDYLVPGLGTVRDGQGQRILVRPLRCDAQAGFQTEPGLGGKGPNGLYCWACQREQRPTPNVGVQFAFAVRGGSRCPGAGTTRSMTPCDLPSAMRAATLRLSLPSAGQSNRRANGARVLRLWRVARPVRTGGLAGLARAAPCPGMRRTAPCPGWRPDASGQAGVSSA